MSIPAPAPFRLMHPNCLGQYMGPQILLQQAKQNIGASIRFTTWLIQNSVLQGSSGVQQYDIRRT